MLVTPPLPEVSSEADLPSGLEALLRHPAIWRGRSAAQVETVSSGFAALDEALPGGGWPRAGLIEILVEHSGIGELYVLLPALAGLTRGSFVDRAVGEAARWCAWVSPPFEPFAPALAAHGVELSKVFVARAPEPLWAFEQCLVSGACEVALAWVERVPARDIRRLQLAAEKGRSLGVLFRPKTASRESSSAVLRVVAEPVEQGNGVRLTLLKSRGGSRGQIVLEWNGAPVQGRTPTADPHAGSL